jgi:RNA polymerase sigma factor (sigma-70 family)
MGSVNFTDTELLRGLAEKNEVMLRHMYNAYFRSIRRFVIYNTGTDDDAKDLFQEVLLVLFRKSKERNFNLTCSLGTYIYSVSRLLWLKELDKRKRRAEKPVETDEYVDADADIEATGDYNERILMYRKHFEKLSSDCKKVLTLFLDGHTIAEITVMMGYSSDQHTKNRRYRCKQSLINSIHGEYGLK